MGGPRKAECRIGTLNIRGGLEDTVHDLVDVMTERRLDVLCVMEIKRNGSVVGPQSLDSLMVWCTTKS